MHFISEMGVKSEQEEAPLKAIDTTHKYKHDEIEPEQNLFRIEATLTNEETRPTLCTDTILLHHRKGKKNHRSARRTRMTAGKIEVLCIYSPNILVLSYQ